MLMACDEFRVTGKGSNAWVLNWIYPKMLKISCSFSFSQSLANWRLFLGSLGVADGCDHQITTKKIERTLNKTYTRTHDKKTRLVFSGIKAPGVSRWLNVWASLKDNQKEVTLSDRLAYLKDKCSLLGTDPPPLPRS